MMTVIQWMIRAPIFPDDSDKTRAAQVLNSLLLSLILVSLLAIIASVFFFAQKLGSLLVSGGMTSIDAHYYLALTVVAGLLLGDKATLIVALVSGLAGLGMIVAETLGHPLPRLFPVPARAGWLNLVFGLYLVSITLNIALRSLHNAIETARQELAERRKAQDALRESEERYRAVMEQSADCIYLVEPDTKRVIEANPAFCALMGYTPEQILSSLACSSGCTAPKTMTAQAWGRRSCSASCTATAGACGHKPNPARAQRSFSHSEPVRRSLGDVTDKPSEHPPSYCQTSDSTKRLFQRYTIHDDLSPRVDS